MEITAQTAEQICRFPLPTRMPSFWITLAGVIGGDEQHPWENAPVTSIEYILSGSGILWAEETAHYPMAGDICVLTENIQRSYCAEKTDGWKKIVIHLKGTAADSFVQAFGLDDRVVFKDCQQLKPIFEELLETVKRDMAVEQIMENCSMLLMKLLSRLCQQQNPGVPEEVRVVKRFIDNNCMKNLTMTDISAAVFRSNDYVQKLFKRTYGITPYAYYMDRKMAHAKHLLLHTALPVCQIAERLGYKNERYFSAQFRRREGMSASQYRKRMK